MKLMPDKSIKFMAITVILAFSAVAAMAQDAGPTGGSVTPHIQGGRQGARGAEGPMIMLFQEMKLNKDQMKQLRGVMATQRKETVDFMKAHTGDRAAIMQFRKDELAKTQASLGKILTPDQMTMYTEWQADERLMYRYNDARGLKAANLTSDEKLQVMGLKRKMNQEDQAFIVKNLSDTAAIQSHLEQANATYVASLQKLLTSDQWQQYQAASMKHGRKRTF